MQNDIWLDKFPFWGVFLLTIATVMLSIYIGTYLGNLKRRRPDYENEASLGTILGATLGLLGFLLVFTFGIAAENFQNRRLLLLKEINAIGTTYLRAAMLLEPHGSEVRKLLREYVDVRVRLSKEKQLLLEKFDEAKKRSELLQDQMWQHAVDAAGDDRNSVIDALFVNSLNEMIDLHTSRVTVFTYRIPSLIWNVLYFITILSMLTVGYQAGLSGKNCFKISLVLALTFTVVILLVIDLDRAAKGSIRVSQKQMIELHNKLQFDAQQESTK